ncbi:MAG: hypothetical protein A2240_01750 [Candidatus Jacksonbacteria bacterium RIFOXYA2_FULL_43_12]|nr:MAG: hypothetical protein A2240_01750 [Candidatus Jacksonbacteria bacterium RIFOXYA2_FULL_43_12]
MSAETQPQFGFEQPEYQPNIQVLTAEKEKISTPEETDQKIIDWAKEWLEKAFDQNQNLDPDIPLEVQIGIQNELETKIANLTDPQYLTTGYLSPEYKNGVNIFFSELVKFIGTHARSANKLERDKLTRFIGTITNTLFSSSGSIDTQMDADVLLLETAKLTRIPQARGFLSSGILSSLAYQLQFSGEAARRIIKSFPLLPPEEQMDVLKQLATVGATALGTGYLEAFGLVKKIVEQGQNENNSPLVQYEANLVLEQLNQETHSPSLDLVTSGRPDESRLAEKGIAERLTESQKWESLINSDLKPSNDTYARVAADAIATLDHSGLPQKLTQLELSTLPEKPNAINLGILKRVLYKADNPDEYHLDLINDLRTTNLQIIEKLNGKENPAQEWAGISDVLSEREWADYLDLCNQKKQWDVQFRQKQEDVEKERLMQAEQASLDFLIFFQNEAPKIIEQDTTDKAQMLKQLYDNFNSHFIALQQNHDPLLMEQAFSAAEKFIYSLRYKEILSESIRLHNYVQELDMPKDAKESLLESLYILKDSIPKKNDYPPEVQLLINQHEALNLRHRQVNEQALTELKNYADSLVPKDAEEKFLTLINKLKAQYPEFADDLGQYLTNLQADLAPNYFPAHFIDYQDSPDDPALNPFPEGSADENIALFLQDLHSPAMRDKIEEDLGFSLNELPLNSQIHLLRYLAKQNNTEWQQISAVFKQNQATQPELAISFLACAENQQYGDLIIDLASRLENRPELTKQVLEQYGEIVTFAQKFRQIVMPYLLQEAPNFNQDDFFRGMLHSANIYLVISEQEIRNNPNIEYQTILDTLKEQCPGFDPSNCAEAVIAEAVVELVNQVGLEKTRDVLNRVARNNSDQNVQELINTAISFITPPVDGTAVHRVDDLYEHLIKFEGYEYSTHEAELKLLNKYTTPNDLILDDGCGTGRLLIPLRRELGRNVTGLDYTGRHVNYIKKQLPDAPILQGDWTNLGLKKEAFTVVYSLGRNILHEYRPERQNQLFAEANRVLQIGGKFIIDIPDRDLGHYKKIVDAHREIMQERGIETFRQKGLIYDSPDDKNYSTRYLYSEDDILKLATSNGFEIEVTERAPLNNGYDDENIYYVLKKVAEVASNADTNSNLS